jgi:cyclomaltodextrinase / maltogenic alpha-amylase / neopullulanase
MGFVGAPCIYYGDEVGLLGERDPDCRRGMPWDTGLWNKDLLDFTQKAVAARRRIQALRRGEFKMLETKGMAVLFERKTDSSRALVGLNAGETAVSFDVAGVFADALNGSRVEQRLELAGRSGTILEAV